MHSSNGGLMYTAPEWNDMQFQWCGGAVGVHVGGRRLALPRKATALLAYLTLEAGPHSRAQLSALLWPESDEVHAAMSLRQALSKLRDLLGPALVADRRQVSLQRQGLPLDTICDVHRFEAAVVRDPVVAGRTEVHRFLDALVVEDAPDFVHWCDRTRARLARQCVAALARAAEESRVRRDWRQLREVSERWLTIDPVSVEAAGHAIESAFLTHDPVGALTRRDHVVQALARDDLATESALGRLNGLVSRYQSLAHLTPSGGMRSIGSGVSIASPPSIQTEATPWHALALCERDEAWRTVTAAFDRVQRSASSVRLTLGGGIGAGRSRFLRDAVTLMAERGAAVMTVITHEASVPFSAIASLIKSVRHEDALAGLDERVLRTLNVLAPELTDAFPILRRASTVIADHDATFAVQLQEALVQLCGVCTEDHPLVIVLDEAMDFDRDSAVTLQVLASRVGALPILWLATDADDEVQAREQGEWASFLRRGEWVELSPLTPSSVARLLSESSGIMNGWDALASRVHAAAHGLPGHVVDVLQLLEVRWGRASADWQQRSVADVPLPPLSPRFRARIAALDAIERTMLLSLALVMETGHPVGPEAWRARPVLTPDDLSHIHGISRLRAAVLGATLVECRLAHEGDGGFRCASPAVVAHVLAESSGLVRDELRQLVSARIMG